MDKAPLIIPGSIWRHKRWHTKIKVTGVAGTQVFYRFDSGRRNEVHVLNFLSTYERAT